MLQLLVLTLCHIVMCVFADGYQFTKNIDAIEEMVADAVKKIMIPVRFEQMEENLVALQRKVDIQEAKIAYLEATKLDHETLIKQLLDELNKSHRHLKLRNNVTQSANISKSQSSLVDHKQKSVNNKTTIYNTIPTEEARPFVNHGTKSSTNYRGRRENSDVIVAFSTYLGQYIERLGPGYIVKCNNVILNKANAYNPQTGVFTAPFDGVYQFDYHFDSSRHTVLALFIDGVNQLDAVTFPTAHQEAMGGNLILAELKAGQEVWLEGRIIADGIVIGDDSFRYTTFSGVMLYRISNDIKS